MSGSGDNAKLRYKEEEEAEVGEEKRKKQSKIPGLEKDSRQNPPSSHGQNFTNHKPDSTY